MRKVLHIIVCLLLVSVSSCDVHQWPEAPGYVKCDLRLSYETDLTEWLHLYEDDKVVGLGLGETYDNSLRSGMIRYIIRTYPVSSRQRMVSDYVQEFVFTKDIAEGYDHEVTLDLLPGDYNMMVWSDLVQKNGEEYFHDAANFAEISLQGAHRANTDYRDAFRGTAGISLVSDIVDRPPYSLEIVMQRPLAKFEFITNDVEEFIDKEITRISSKTQTDKSSSGDITTKVVNLEDYKVVFYYVGFMPDVYSLLTDKPVDSSTGVLFESTLKKVTESSAGMGFDYVFVNGKESAVTVKIGIYDNEGTQLSMTEPIEVPLKRSHHTIINGSFLMSEATGGVTIHPDFDGDYNLIFP